MSIRVVNRGEFGGGNLGGKHDARRIKGWAMLDSIFGYVTENNKKVSEKIVHFVIRWIRKASRRSAVYGVYYYSILS